MTPPVSLRRHTRIVIIFILVAYALTYIFSHGKYGLSWDIWELYTGDQNLNYYLSLDPERLTYSQTLPIYESGQQPDLHAICHQAYRTPATAIPHEIWPVGSLLAAISNRIVRPVTRQIGFEPYTLFLLPVMLVLMWCTYRFISRRLGISIAVGTVLILATLPRLQVHAHVNFKDVPGVLLFALTAFTFYAGITREQPGKVILAAIFWGICLSTNSVSLLAPLILIPWYVWHRIRESRSRNWRPSRGEIYTLLAFPLLGIVTMLLCWPYLLVRFPSHLTAYIQSVIDRGKGGTGGIDLTPLIYLLTGMPLTLTLAMFIGIITLWYKKRVRPLYVLLMLWLWVPVLRVCLPGAKDFDGIRHWLIVVIPIAIFAGTGILWIANVLKRHLPEKRLLITLLVACLVVLPAVIFNSRHQPYQLAYFNSLVGGLGGAQNMQLRSASDYWCMSYKEAARWLNQHEPGHAIITATTAEHMLFFMHGNWLESRFQPVSLLALGEPGLAHMCTEQEAPIYLLQAPHEVSIVPKNLLRERGRVVHTITFDRGLILNIWHLNPRQQR